MGWGSFNYIKIKRDLPESEKRTREGGGHIFILSSRISLNTLANTKAYGITKLTTATNKEKEKTYKNTKESKQTNIKKLNLVIVTTKFTAVVSFLL